MGDKTLGLIDKFIVTRTDDSSDPGGKHEECEYFVLDITHDKHARPAILAYIESCRKDGYRKLAFELHSLLLE